MTGKKKSTFITQDSVPDNHFVDTFGAGVNRKVPWLKFLDQVKEVLVGPSVLQVQSITDLATIKRTPNQQYSRAEFWPGTGVGGVKLVWEAARDVSEHNGGTIIDPAKISELNTTNKTFGTYFIADAVSGNTGCFVVSKSWIDPYLFGALGNDTNDDTLPLTKCFELGGDIRPEKGTYLIVGPGPDSGGVYVETKNSTKVSCNSEAIFKASDLDEDMIRFFVPSSGSGLPADGITFEWSGGVFDQRDQKVSNVVPFAVEYPPPAGLDGTSNTTDGLSVRGEYDSGGTEFSGIKRCLIEGVTTIAGTHWESAGGDSGVFVSGCSVQEIRGCRSFGNRDLAVYASGAPNGTVLCKSLVHDNIAVNCFHGFAVKRSASGSMNNNHSENCPRGLLIDLVSGSGAEKFSVYGNTGNKVGTALRAQRVSGLSVFDNHVTNIGATLEDGTTVEPLAGGSAYVYQGCSNSSFRYNTALGITSGADTAYSSTLFLLLLEDSATIESENIVCVGNEGDGLRTAGADSGSNNSFIDNVVFNAITSSSMTVLGTNAYEIRRDPLNNLRQYRHPVLFNDGTSQAPIIARGAQPAVGVRFSTNYVSFSLNEVDRLAASTTGVGFNDTTPIAKPALPAAATDQASTTALANDIRQALIDYGLCS